MINYQALPIPGTIFISLDTVRYAEPDQSARSYLKVIAVDPEGTAAELRKGAA